MPVKNGWNNCAVGRQEPEEQVICFLQCGLESFGVKRGRAAGATRGSD